MLLHHTSRPALPSAFRIWRQTIMYIMWTSVWSIHVHTVQCSLSVVCLQILLPKYGEIVTASRQLMKKCSALQTTSAKNLTVLYSLRWTVIQMLCHLYRWTALDSLWRQLTFTNQARTNESIPEVRKPSVQMDLPVCAELRTSRRTGVLSWTTLGWVDTAARADKHRWRTAWWESCSETVLLLSWSMDSEQRRGKGLQDIFMKRQFNVKL